jgi:diguanylate cyclase (GGDEF)-like protein/PAS domain S-box-containing protein
MYPTTLSFILVTSLLAAGITFYLTAYAWGHRNLAGASGFCLFMLSAASWSLMTALRIIGPTTAAFDLWTNVTYTAIAWTPAFWLITALQYTGRTHWLNPWRLIVWLLVPSVSTVLTWINFLHPWFVQATSTRAGVYFVQASLTYGPWFPVHTYYSYLLTVAGCTLMLIAAWRTFAIYRSQAIALLIGALSPLIGSMLMTFWILPARIQMVNTIPYSLALSGIAFAWAILRYRLFDLRPIARDMLIEDMGDGMLVLDVQDRVVDFNQAMISILGILREESIGRPAEEVLTQWSTLKPQLVQTVKTQMEISVTTDEGEIDHYDLRICPLFNRRDHLAGHLIVWRNINELKRAQAELYRLATTDSLTQTSNRLYFERLARAELKRAARFHRPVAVMMMDIDYFKHINDRFGHSGGDQALAAFSKACRQNIREIDSFARFGGDEFVLLMPETKEDEAYKMAERLRLALAQSPIEIDGHSVSVTISVGIATLMDEGDNLERMQERADRALYSAKQGGRNRTVLWQQALFSP